jgi:hypothetical protein
MNKGKPLIIALLVLGVLIVASLLVWRDPFEKASRPTYADILPARAEGSVDKIAVTTREGAVTAEKRADHWWVIEPREFPADDGVIKAAAASLEKLAIQGVASKKLERQTEYGLGKDSIERIEVKTFAGGVEVLSFAAGKRSPDGQGSFIVLFKDPNTVYVTSEMVPFILSRGVKEWRSKFILDLRREAIVRILVVNNKGTFDLGRENGDQWRKKNAPPWLADNTRFGQVLDSFSRLPWSEVVDAPDPAFDYGFKKPQARVTAVAEGKDHILVFGKDVEGASGNCWLKLDGDPKVYQVRKAILERFTRDFEYYRGEAAKPE